MTLEKRTRNWTLALNSHSLITEDEASLASYTSSAINRGPTSIMQGDRGR